MMADDEKQKSRSPLQVLMEGIHRCEDYHDLFFKVGDPTLEGDTTKFERIGSVRAVVAGSSKVFHAMLYGNMMEASPGVDVQITDFSPESFHSLLEYIFTNSVKNLNFKNVDEVFRIADKYDVPDLRKECLRYIRENRRIAIILLERHCRNYHGFGTPPIVNVGERVTYYPEYSITEFRQAVTDQLGIPPANQQYFSFSTETYVHHEINSVLKLNKLQDDMKLNDIWPNGNVGNLFLRVLKDNEDMVVHEDDYVVCLKHYDNLRRQLYFIGMYVIPSYSLDVTYIFDIIRSATKGKFPNVKSLVPEEDILNITAEHMKADLPGDDIILESYAGILIVQDVLGVSELTDYWLGKTIN